MDRTSRGRKVLRYAAGIATETAFILGLTLIAFLLAVIGMAVWR
jgi:hypothetical protein